MLRKLAKLSSFRYLDSIEDSDSIEDKLSRIYDGIILPAIEIRGNTPRVLRDSERAEIADIICKIADASIDGESMTTLRKIFAGFGRLSKIALSSGRPEEQMHNVALASALVRKVDVESLMPLHRDALLGIVDGHFGDIGKVLSGAGILPTAPSAAPIVFSREVAFKISDAAFQFFGRGERGPR